MRRSSKSVGWRTAVVPVHLSNGDYRRAHDACHRAGLFWTDLVGQVHDFWDQKQHDPDLAVMYKMVTDPELHRLHAHTKQGIAHDLVDAIATSRTNKAEGLDVKAPWRAKNYRPLSFTRGFGWRITPQGKLGLSLGKQDGQIIVALPQVRDARSGELVGPEMWGEVRLCWDRHNRCWSLHIAHQTVKIVRPKTNTVIAVDEGIINPMTAAVKAVDGFDVVVVNGRAARAIKHRRNKAVARLERAKARCAKRAKDEQSRKWRRLERAKKRACGKAERALRNIDHQVSRKIADFAQTHQAGRIVVGDVRGIEQKTRQKQRASKDQRRRLSQWSRGRQERYLAEKTGIELTHIPEHGTSKTCPVCLAHNRPRGRNYRCQNCGFVCHRDAVGAINIHQLHIYGKLTCIDPNSIIRVIYLRATPYRAAQSKAPNQATTPTTCGVAERSTPLCDQPTKGNVTDTVPQTQKPRP